MTSVTSHPVHPINTRAGRRLYLTGRAVAMLPDVLLFSLLGLAFHVPDPAGMVWLCLGFLAVVFGATYVSRHLYRRSTWYVPYRDRGTAPAPLSVDVSERALRSSLRVGAVFVALHVGHTDPAWGAAGAGVFITVSAWTAASGLLNRWWWWRATTGRSRALLMQGIVLATDAITVALAWQPATARPAAAQVGVVLMAGVLCAILTVKLCAQVFGANMGSGSRFPWPRPADGDHPQVSFILDYRLAPEAAHVEPNFADLSTADRVDAVAMAREMREHRDDQGLWRDSLRQAGLGMCIGLGAWAAALAMTLLVFRPQSGTEWTVVFFGSWITLMALLTVMVGLARRYRSR